MRMILLSAAMTAALVLAPLAAAWADPESEAHAHMGHVMTAWTDTPEGQGLLPTAVAEADNAVQHAGFAAQKPNDLEWMQAHIGHVLHALDPSVQPKGLGLGYGVKKAANGTATHIELAAKSVDASENVKLHSVHVATCARNTVARAERIVVLVQEVQATDSADEAAALVAEILVVSGQLRAGVDADGDGTISWQEGEGGLDEAVKHMVLMQAGEGF